MNNARNILLSVVWLYIMTVEHVIAGVTRHVHHTDRGKLKRERGVYSRLQLPPHGAVYASDEQSLELMVGMTCQNDYKELEVEEPSDIYKPYGIVDLLHHCVTYFCHVEDVCELLCARDGCVENANANVNEEFWVRRQHHSLHRWRRERRRGTNMRR